jgi:RNA polymerase primary sigma factor
LSKEPLSLDAPRGPDSDARLGDSIPDSSVKNSMVQAVERERSEQLGRLLGSLSPRERDMVRMRFGLDGSDECTLEQIGVSFSITRERVRQIVGTALEKLNRQTRALQLELRGGAE